MVPILQMRKLWLREVISLSKTHSQLSREAEGNQLCLTSSPCSCPCLLQGLDSRILSMERWDSPIHHKGILERKDY